MKYLERLIILAFLLLFLVLTTFSTLTDEPEKVEISKPTQTGNRKLYKGFQPIDDQKRERLKYKKAKRIRQNALSVQRTKSIQKKIRRDEAGKKNDVIPSGIDKSIKTDNSNVQNTISTKLVKKILSEQKKSEKLRSSVFDMNISPRF